MKKIKVGLTYDLSKDYELSKTDPADKYYEFDTVEIIKDIKNGLNQAGHDVVDIGNYFSLLERYKDITNQVDIVLNLAEGLIGRNREAQVPVLLEAIGVPYIGSDGLSMSLTLDKGIAKKFMQYETIKTPKFWIISDWSLLKNDIEITYPVIVKPCWEGSSKGIDIKSKVINSEQLEERIKFINDSYQQPALVEEFITGREFTVGIVGNPNAYKFIHPLEVIIRGESVGDKMFLSRYVYSSDVQYSPVEDEQLKETLITIARKVFESLECRDFGRVDFRMNQQGDIFVLEINPLPALSIQDAFGVIAQHNNLTYAQLLSEIVQTALKRYGKV